MKTKLLDGEKSLNKVPLWVEWTNELRELFKQDPEIKMSLDEKKHIVTMVIDNTMKYLAIKELIPSEKQCNDILVKIEIKRKDRRGGDKFMPEVIAAALDGNPLFQYLHVWDDPRATNCPFSWCVMDNKVVQYPNDDLADLWSYKTILPEELARDMFKEVTDYTWFCSKIEGKPIAPGGKETSYNLPEEYNKSGDNVLAREKVENK